MSAYFIVGTKLNKQTQISREQFADSNYYLGFLFTLVSLSASLFSIALVNGSINTLIGQFGLALMTTLFGLFVRIYIINFSPTTQANIDTFDTIISDKLRIVNGLISDHVEKNIIFSNVMDEKMHIFSDGMHKTLDLFLNDFSTKVNASTNELIATLHTINQQVAREVKNQVEQVKGMPFEVNKSHQAHSTQLVTTGTEQQKNSAVKHNRESGEPLKLDL